MTSAHLLKDFDYDLPDELLARIPLRERAVDELVALLGHYLRVLLAHGLADDVRLAEGIPREPLDDE